jgi:hypothetical protein
VSAICQRIPGGPDVGVHPRVDVPPVQEKVEPRPVKEIKPEMADALTAKDSESDLMALLDRAKGVTAARH